MTPVFIVARRPAFRGELGLDRLSQRGSHALDRPLTFPCQFRASFGIVIAVGGLNSDSKVYKRGRGARGRSDAYVYENGGHHGEGEGRLDSNVKEAVPAR